ncbi:MAG: energy-coupling factor transporter transmembrane protein EcfT [Oscillospiraceae bacterium]|nr:energy-coupling factor transporter transmembrane protein EcfT [Oscillospiraceae bacterium]
MLKDVTLGQFFPGDTVVHRLDPRTKLILVIVYIVALFAAKTYAAYALVMIVLIVCVSLSQIRFTTIMKGVKPILIVILITGILNLFFTQGEHVIFRLWKLTMTWEGVRTAALMILRLIMLINGTFLLTYTTSPIALTDGLELLLSPLKKLRFPVHELAMMMSIALRFIPTLIEETDKIMSAQKARGADFDTGGIVQRAKAMLPLLVPLFVSAFRRADELSVAMESRCYHGGEGRTRMKKLTFARRDFGALILGAVFLAAVFALNRVWK